MKLVAGDYPWRPGRTDAELRDLAAARQRTIVRLWLPLTPVFVLLAPLALIAAPLLALFPVARGVSPWRTVWGFGGVLLALSGTLVDIDSPSVRLRIRIL
jgi:hypothetical protein